MEQSETRAKLVALHKAVERTLEDPRARYFDPPVVLEMFQRWIPVRDALRSEFPSVLGDLPVRETPVSSGTTDHDGRGYVLREPVKQLYDDMQYALDALAGAEEHDPSSDSRIASPADLERKSLSWWLQQLSPRQVWKLLSFCFGLLLIAFNIGAWVGGLYLPYFRDLPWFPHQKGPPSYDDPCVLFRTGMQQGTAASTGDGRCLVSVDKVVGALVDLSVTIDSLEPRKFRSIGAGTRITADARDMTYYVDIEKIRGNLVDLTVYRWRK